MIRDVGENMLSKLSEASLCKLFGRWGGPSTRLSVSTTRFMTCGRSVTTRRVGRRNSGLLSPATGRRRRDLAELCRKQMHNFHHGHRSMDACVSNQLQKVTLDPSMKWLVQHCALVSQTHSNLVTARIPIVRPLLARHSPVCFSKKSHAQTKKRSTLAVGDEGAIADVDEYAVPELISPSAHELHREAPFACPDPECSPFFSEKSSLRWHIKFEHFRRWSPKRS